MIGTMDEPPASSIRGAGFELDVQLPPLGATGQVPAIFGSARSLFVFVPHRRAHAHTIHPPTSTRLLSPRTNTNGCPTLISPHQRVQTNTISDEDPLGERSESETVTVAEGESSNATGGDGAVFPSMHVVDFPAPPEPSVWVNVLELFEELLYAVVPCLRESGWCFLALVSANFVAFRCRRSDRRQHLSALHTTSSVGIPYHTHSLFNSCSALVPLLLAHQRYALFTFYSIPI